MEWDRLGANALCPVVRLTLTVLKVGIFKNLLYPVSYTELFAHGFVPTVTSVPGHEIGCSDLQLVCIAGFPLDKTGCLIH